jgi:hypothetical protein
MSKQLIERINACLTTLGKPAIKSIHTKAEGEKRLAKLEAEVAKRQPAPAPEVKPTQTRPPRAVRKEEDKPEPKRPVLAVEDAGRDTTGVAEARLRRIVPAMFASKPAANLSERYAFLSTWDLCEPMLKAGFVITAAQQNYARTKEDMLTTRHMVRLRASNLKPMVGDVFPELLLVNGHNGNVKFMLAAGLYRLVCSNGCVIGSNAMMLTTKHMGDPSALRAEANRVIEHAQRTSRVVKEWMDTELTKRQQNQFAKDAATLAYGEERAGGFEPETLLMHRREADAAPSLWNVYNRVQENVMRGGLQYQNANNRTVQTRGLTRVKRTVGFNMELWNLAERYAKTSTEELLG